MKRLALALAACGSPRGAPADAARTPIARIAIDAGPDAAPPCVRDAAPCATVDVTPSGEWDFETRFERDGGLLVRERLTSTGEAAPFKIREYTYDREGRSREVDTYLHGKLDFVEHYEYRGHEREPSIARFDTDGDGDIDTVKRHTYQRGRASLVHRERDERFDTTTRLLFDERGRIVDWREPSDPSFHGERYVYDGGHVAVVNVKYEHDGTPDIWTTHPTYDACGNLVRTDEDWHSDGAIDGSTIYRYDCR